MSATISLLSILGALLIGAISPGASFVLVSRIAVTASRADGLAAACGMGLGGAGFATATLAGLSALTLRAGWLHLVLKLAGGLYLVWLAVTMWRGAADPVATGEKNVLRNSSLFRSFCLALVTQISNPKTAMVYAGIFAALMPSSPPSWLLVLLPPTVLAVETFWYGTVAFAFSASGPRTVYLGWKSWIDRAAAAVMGALGARLIVDAA